MSSEVQPITLNWVAVGAGAFGLVLADHIAALVYWDGPDLGGSGAVAGAGFSWVAADQPWEHRYLFVAFNPTDADWARARELAAQAYFEYAATESTPGTRERRRAGTASQSRSDGSQAARRRDAELRREAAELLSRAPWFQKERLREELLRREWLAPRSDEHG
jgi:hypothetical protein